MRAVGSPVRQCDHLSGPGIELLPVAELVPQPRTDPQSIGRIDAQVALVEHGMHVGSQQQSVVCVMLAALSDGTDVCGIESGPDLGAGDRAPAVVCVEDRGPEPVLAEADSREALAEHRAVMSPRRGIQVEFDDPALQLRHEDVEVPVVARVVEFVSLALDEVAGEFRRRPDDPGIFKEDSVLQENAADLRIILWAERAEPSDQGAECVERRRAVAESVELPGC